MVSRLIYGGRGLVKLVEPPVLSGSLHGGPPVYPPEAAPVSRTPAAAAPAPAPASGGGGGGECNLNYPGRIQFVQISGPFPPSNVNPWADSPIVRPGFYWFVLDATISMFPGASLGSYGLFLVPPAFAQTFFGNPFVIGAEGLNTIYPPGLIKLTPGYSEEMSSGAYPIAMERRLIVPSGAFLKASLLATAPGAGITAYKIQMSLAYIEIQNSDPIPNLS